MILSGPSIPAGERSNLSFGTVSRLSHEAAHSSGKLRSGPNRTSEAMSRMVLEMGANDDRREDGYSGVRVEPIGKAGERGRDRTHGAGKDHPPAGLVEVA